jgi:GTPase SAR1 family protein
MAKKEIDLTPDYTNENPQTESKPGNVPPSGNDEAEVPSANNSNQQTKHFNDIKVTIPPDKPLVILFGPGSSGKTMTLVRLTRWLEKNRYKVIPEPNFRPSDKEYKNVCESFQKFVHSDYAADQTATLNFILLTVMNEYGEPICRILEAPGEHYFKKDNPKNPFPSYIKAICNSSNSKTWVFIVEKDWGTHQNKLDYAQKICELQSEINTKKDRVIFTCHKADLHPYLINGTIPNTKQFFKDIKGQYPGIFSRYENQNPLTKFVNPYNFDFVVFSAGSFSEIEGQTSIKYDAGPERYPAELWQAILKTVKGGW